MRHDLTLLQVKGVMTHLADAFADDDQLKLDMLEGETDLFEQVRRLLDGIERDEGDKAALETQIEARQIRMKRCGARIEARREAISELMECAGLDKLPLPEASISLRHIAPKPVFPNLHLVPDEYCKFDRKLDREKLKSVSTDALPSWATMDNGGVSLTIRRK